MTNETLKKIADGPVYLLEGNDGMVHGNSQALALELMRSRAKARVIYQALDQYIKNTEYTKADVDRLLLIGRIRVAAYDLSGDKVRDV